MYSVNNSHNASKIQMKLTQFIYFFKKISYSDVHRIYSSFLFVIIPVVVKAPVYLPHQSYISARPFGSLLAELQYDNPNSSLLVQ